MCPAPVYPRVGGGTVYSGTPSPSLHGLSPSGRGEPVRPRPRKPSAKGLSPRGRGNRGDDWLDASGTRSIPAWAGEPRVGRKTRSRMKVYPRVGGGTMVDPKDNAPQEGLSPRGRGNRWVMPTRKATLRSIPAWAGEPSWSFPREEVPHGLSPRGRGNLTRREAELLQHRSIPAWAGEPQKPGRTSSLGWVYPRVGGGTVGSCLERLSD